MYEYRLLDRMGYGAFSEVLLAQSVKTGYHVAIKCLKNQFQSLEMVKKNREIYVLRHLNPHDNIITLIEVLYDEPTSNLALVFELMDQNLYERLKDKKQPLTPKKIKWYMYQLLKAIQYVHRRGFFHRDIKPENVMVTGDRLKLADFGTSCGKYLQQPLTEYIATRWYRAPYCLMTDGYYDFKMDMWSFGCILYEMLTKLPLFNGYNELDQIHKIHNVLGTPPALVLCKFKNKATHMTFNFPKKKGSGLEPLLMNASKDVIDLLYRLLYYDPVDRISADEALYHYYFAEFNQKTTHSRDFKSTFYMKFPYTHTIMQHYQTPEKYKSLKKSKITKVAKKQASKAMIDEESSLLPPIHHVGVYMRVNFYAGHPGETFKKTNTKFDKKKEDYVLMGKKMG